MRMFTEKEVAEMIEQQLNKRVDSMVAASLSYCRLLDIREYIAANKLPPTWVETLNQVIALFEGEEEKEKNETQKTR